jgi:hypothetical protein
MQVLPSSIVFLMVGGRIKVLPPCKMEMNCRQKRWILKTMLLPTIKTFWVVCLCLRCIWVMRCGLGVERVSREDNELLTKTFSDK